MNHDDVKACREARAKASQIAFMLFIPCFFLVAPCWVLGYIAGVLVSAAYRGFVMGRWMIHRVTDCDHGRLDQ